MIKNLPIRLKMTALYINMTVFTVPLLIILMICGFWQNGGQSNIISGTVAANSSLSSVSSGINLSRAGLTAAVMSMESPEVAASALAEAESARQQIASGLGTLDKTAAADLQKNYLDGYAASFDTVAGTIKAGDAALAKEQLAALSAQGTAAVQQIDKLTAQNNLEAQNIHDYGRKVMSYMVIFVLVYVAVYIFVTILIGRKLARTMAFPLQDLGKAAAMLAEGDVNIVVDYESNDEIGFLAKEFRRMLEGMKQQADVITQMSSGDYTGSISVRSENDVVNTAISNMLESNNALISDIILASQQVASGAQQIAHGAQSLASGATQQAASVQELSASISIVLDKTQSNSDAAQEALSISKQVGQHMEQGSQSMNGVIEAMRSIDSSSRDITKVIKVIEDIAFQTNILALNAAVEAARAGQHGKGFAVVADEVRDLAGKSAAAAKESTALIEDSLRRVEDGNSIVAKANKDMQSVGELTGKSQELTQRIAQDSAEQASSLQEISTGIEQISHVVQANSATSEQSAASAEEMSAQADSLKSTVGRFSIKEGARQMHQALPPSGVNYSYDDIPAITQSSGDILF